MNKYAFLVGVGEYDSPTISSVPFATRDAETIGGILRDRCGFRATILPNPGAVEVARSLGDLISLIEDPDDLFCFFFAGHGAVYEGESYLLLKDAYPEARGVGMYQLSALQEQFARLRSRSRLVFLDCCRNDPRVGRGDAANLMSGRLSAALNGLGARDIGLAAAEAGGERLTLLLKACREGERAYEWEARRHGAFSWFLKEGLEGAAWQGGELKAHELCTFVARKVREWAEPQKLSQHPEFRQEGAAGNIVLAGPDPAELERRRLEAKKKEEENLLRKLQEKLKESQALFECPLCGKLNPAVETFRCKGCGRDKLCRSHQDPTSFLCMECERKRRKAEEEERREAARRQEEERKRVEAGRREAARRQEEEDERRATERRPGELELEAERWRQERRDAAKKRKPSSGGPSVALLCLALIGCAWWFWPRLAPHVEPLLRSGTAVDGGSGPTEPRITQEAKKPASDAAAPKAPPAPRTTAVLPGGARLDFALVPAGDFMMGSPEGEGEDSERPRHKVTITKPFYLGHHEVTQAQWQAVMGKKDFGFPGADRPAEMVSWEEVQTFIERLNRDAGHKRYRLPTEAEWEYAARAGDETGQPDKTAWCGKTVDAGTRPVGAGKTANGFGLYDMLGNVAEWVADWNVSYAEAPHNQADVRDPRRVWAGRKQERVLRGGHFMSPVAGCRAAARSAAAPDYADPGVGFRVALDVKD